ncbi:hypothetical protein [Rhodovulum sulfidophilum]|uniref:hypothetical protein n=1 Tax=Rhodovulum sulfidophilum TaxID=35806 RepID=UPI000952105F|nr:hypothetical protein [Rhodovulum sulfidophilum]MBL3551490.1 hypothetical protein [Rhodovulum sulfidophilum]OLS42619.1 hypothetical protein BV379_19645 [Rhodovulum sulfidophilum]
MKKQFDQASEGVRAQAQEMGLGDDIVAQGSCAGGMARAGSDMDITIRASPDRFDEIINDPNIVPNRILHPNPGSAAERTRNLIIQ